MFDEPITDMIELSDTLDNFKDIFTFLGNALTRSEQFSEREKNGAFFCFQIAGQALENSLDYVNQLLEAERLAEQTPFEMPKQKYNQ